ncbi:MAG: ABC transporter substrate-binding protein [Deltaproteobacteria bacterium]|nr:ABC transporter substrate-binding protein [Deltaproteobacteria bacterium]
MKRGKGLVAVLVFGILLLHAGLGFSAESMKIGTLLATSGRFAFLGDPERKGVELAIEEINAAGGVLGKRMEIVSYDDEGNPGKTTNLIDRLISNDKVVGVIGASTSGTINVVAMAVEKAGIPQFYISGNSAICKGNKWVFNAAPADELDAEGMIDFIKENLKSTKIGIIHDANEYGSRSTESFLEMIGKRAPGIKIAGVEKYQSSDRDMSAQLINLKNAGSQCIVIWGVGFAPAVIVKNWHQLGMKEIRLMGGAGMGSHKMIESLGEAGEGLLFNTVLNYGAPNEKEKAFIENYKKKFGTVPPTFAAVGYDAAFLLASALKSAGGDGGKLADAIYNIRDFPGVQGTFNFANNRCNGLMPGCYVMAVVENKDYYPAEKVYPK